MAESDNGSMTANGQTSAAGGTSSRPQQRSYAVVLASFLFSAATYAMFWLYSILHLDIMFRMTLDAQKRPDAVLTVLGILEQLRAVFALLAFAAAVWSFRTSSRWVSTIAIAVSLGGLGTILVTI